VDDDGKAASIAVAPVKPALDNARFESAVASIQAGKYTKEQLIEKWTLSEVQLKALEV
jgi:hypothetical protein